MRLYVGAQTQHRSGEPLHKPRRTVMCRKSSPRGNLVCTRVDCDGIGHVWEHPSAARDAKAEADAHCQDY